MGETTGPNYKTAYRWFRAGILPVPMKQLLTGTILVEPVPLAEKRGAAVYARVASGDQKKDLARQLARLVEHATAQGLSIVKSVSEIGAGRNGHRAKLVGLLRDPTIAAIVVEHRGPACRPFFLFRPMRPTASLGQPFGVTRDTSSVALPVLPA